MHSRHVMGLEEERTMEFMSECLEHVCMQIISPPGGVLYDLPLGLLDDIYTFVLLQHVWMRWKNIDEQSYMKQRLVGFGKVNYREALDRGLVAC